MASGIEEGKVNNDYYKKGKEIMLNDFLNEIQSEELVYSNDFYNDDNYSYYDYGHNDDFN